MNPLTNPYKVLGIPENASNDQIDQAFVEKRDYYDQLDKLSRNQQELYNHIHDAYSLLSDPNIKEMIDLDLNTANHNTNSMLDDVTVDHVEEDGEKELSREKTIGVKPQRSNAFPKVLIVFGLAIFGVYMYGQNSEQESSQKILEAKNQLEADKQQQLEVDKAEKARLAQQPIQLIAPPNQITDNILYPSPQAFQEPDLKFTPQGELFPSYASLIPSMPQTHKGTGSILIQNPHDSAIFGKLVVQFSESVNPIVIRNFYIPAKHSLEIFETPTGKYQIQILTLNKPTAYVSPPFTVPLYSDAKTVKLADWSYAYDPSQVF